MHATKNKLSKQIPLGKFAAEQHLCSPFWLQHIKQLAEEKESFCFIFLSFLTSLTFSLQKAKLWKSRQLWGTK